jgi:hypothetical protein
MADVLSRETDPPTLLAHPIRTDHPGEGKPPWKDNAYLAFWDPASGVNGVVHASTSPNASGRRVRASVSIGAAVAELAEDPPAGSFTTPSISFGLDGEITVHSPELQAELRLAPRGVAADYSAGKILPELVPGESLKHYQQAAIVTGIVTVGGITADVDGVGLRDRTWGYRDESAMFPEYIGLIADIDGELLTVMKFAHADGSSRAEGFVLGDVATRVTELTNIARDASGLFAAAEITIDGKDGLELRATRRTGGFWVPMGWERIGPTMSAYDEFLEIRTGTGRTGYGLVEQGIIRRLG